METPNPREFFSAEYEQLRRVADRLLRRDARSTINPTALVNEAFLKVVDSASVRPVSELHLQRIIICAMREVLVDQARRRATNKRGAAYVRVTLNEEGLGLASGAEDFLILDAALEELARVHEGRAQVAEYRLFGGFEFEEIARMMNLSRATVMRYWKAAQAWLRLKIRNAG